MKINEAIVGRILNLIAYQPNRRNSPLPGDLPGNYDHWFDGGAVSVMTGTTKYYFLDGTRASVPTLPYLMVIIKFPDGRSVTVSQQTEP